MLQGGRCCAWNRSLLCFHLSCTKLLPPRLFLTSIKEKRIRNFRIMPLIVLPYKHGRILPAYRQSPQLSVKHFRKDSLIRVFPIIHSSTIVLVALHFYANRVLAR